MNTFKTYSKSIIGAIAYFLLFTIAQTIIMVGALIIKICTDSEYAQSVQDMFTAANNGADITNVYVELVGSLTVYIEIMLLIFMLCIFIIKHKHHSDRFAFRKIEIQDIFLFISVGLALNIVSSIAVNLLDTELVESTGYEDTTTLLIQGGFLGVMLGIGICAPICEEITFRYLIFHCLNKVNTILAIVVSALLFGIAHGNIIQGTYAFCFGLVFSIINFKYKSILPSIIMHLSVNISSVILISVENIGEQLLYMLLAFILSTFIITVMEIKKAVDIKKSA